MAFTDNFDGAGAQTNLESWTPSGGGAWTLIDGPAGGIAVRTTGAVRGTSTTAGSYKCTDQGSADNYARARQKQFGTSGTGFYVATRLVDASNLVGFRNTSTGSTGRRLSKIVSGTITDLITSQGVDEEFLKVEANGTTFKLFEGGTGGSPGTWNQIGADQTVSDSVFSGVTVIGLRSANNGAVDQIDDFEAGALGGSPVTITCTPGNAVAAGAAATINSAQTIACAPGNAAAAGVAATINSAQTIACTPGNAVAAGTAATINSAQTIDCAPGNAVAAGTQAVIDSAVTITCTPGNAQADGITAAIEAGGAATITCTPGNAVAAGVTAAINSAQTISCTPGNAAAAGAQAAIDSAVIIVAVPGDAIASGTQAAIDSAVTITCMPGNAQADGITAAIETGGAVTIACTPGNAVAAGVSASIAIGSGDIVIPAARRHGLRILGARPPALQTRRRPTAC